MNEIEVGDYVRTKDGLIAKLINIDEDEYCFDNKIKWYYEYYSKEVYAEDWKDFVKYEVVKHSPNIIDLIEVGDIIRVEGLKHAKEVIEDKFYRYDVFGNDVRAIIDDSGYGNYSKQIKDYKILSVVTHEQYKEMEYKV